MSLEDLLEFIKREKGLAYTTIGNMSSALLGALFWFILASILAVSEYGEVNYYIALASIPAAIGILGLNTTVTTYLAKGEEEIVYEADSITLISSLILATIMVPFQWNLSLILIAMIFYGMAIAEILGRRLYSEYAFVSISSRLVQIALSIALYFKFGLTGILMGYFLGPLLLSYRYLGKLRKFTLKINSLKEKKNFTIHSYGLNLIGSFSVFLDKIIVGTLFGFYALGLYQLGYQFLMFLGLIPGSLYMYLLPEESSGEDRREVKLLGLAFSVIIAVLTFLFSPWIIKTFFPNFTEAIQVVQAMCLAVIPTTIVSLSNARLFGRERSKYTFLGGLIYLIFLITGLVLLGSVMNILGLAFSVILARTAQAIYLWRKSCF